MFNQSKFRLFDATMNGVCRLRLGLTDYKSYVGSNLGPQWKLFYDEGMKVGDPNAFFGNPLGNLTVVVLNDGNHVLLNRSYQVAEGQGKFACVGGHPEPTVRSCCSLERSKSAFLLTMTRRRSPAK